MNDILLRLYESYNSERNMENPLMSSEIVIGTTHFLKNYVWKDGENEEANAALGVLHELIQQKSFEAGFYTAVRLLLQ